MRTRADIETVPIREPQSSLSERPLTVSSMPDFEFLTAAGEVTRVEVKTSQTTTQTSSEPLRIRRPIVHTQPSRLGFILLQKWEGVVVETDDGSFTAKLVDSAGNLPTHDAVFARAELPEDEQSFVEEGATFVWTLGYRKIGSTRERASVVYFRRLPPWNQAEITAAQDRGNELGSSIGWK